LTVQAAGSLLRDRLHYSRRVEDDQLFTVGDPRVLYAAAYRAISTKDGARIEAWPHLLELGGSLPTLPLWLDEDVAVPVDLDETYRSSCDTLRIQTN
jgi:hypothetical protein